MSVTKVGHVHCRVEQRQQQDDSADHFVQVDVLIQRKEVGHSPASQKGDGTSQHQHQDEHAVEV